jgi:hypothetical protein
LSKDTLPVIGWREWIKLPDLGIEKIKVKVDTGARTSSLHADSIQPFKKGNEEWVRFTVNPYQRNSRVSINIESKVLEYRQIRSSNGKTSNRPVIVTNVLLYGILWPVEITLADRDQMGFRMLLGRQAIKGRFLVDVEKSFHSKS